MTELVAADIGGTHARFALARLDGAGNVVALNEPVVMRCAEHASLQMAWETFGTTIGRQLPRAAAIAVAGPVVGEELKLTNNPWVIRPAMVNKKLGVDAHVLVNDFEAVAYAVGACGEGAFQHICGPDVPLPDSSPATGGAPAVALPCVAGSSMRSRRFSGG